jgi:hypothetical protein
MKSHLRYLKELLIHKYWVFVYSIRFGVPLRLAILHDISKFFPIEWFAYVNNFYDADGTKRIIRDKTGAYDTNRQSQSFKRAWIHHQKNKHHWQAWCNIGDNGVVTPIDMPEVYIREMIADWCGAEMSYSGKATPLNWYETNKNKMIITDNTRDILLGIIKDVKDL